MCAKLHELLAVEPDLRGTAEKVLAERRQTFTKKTALFQGQHRSYQPVDDEGERFADEHSALSSTVAAQLDYTRKMVGKYWDAVAQKEKTNTAASANVEVGGQVFLENAPATLLLALEGKLKQLRQTYETIPTLDPSEDWTWDDDTRSHKAEPKDTYKTKRVFKNHVRAPATDKHPAQVDTYQEDTRVGTWTTRKQSGLITPAEKSDLLGRIDTLVQAVKQARQRANDQKVETITVSDKIFDFVHKPLK
jgi:hypothetical protein